MLSPVIGRTWSFVFLFSSSVSFIWIELILILNSFSLNPALNEKLSESSTSLPFGSLFKTRTWAKVEGLQ